MDAQIITAVIGGVAVVVTLCLALLRGFRGLHDKIDSTAKESRESNAALAKGLRKDIAALAKGLRKDIAKNATAITTLEQRLRKDIAKNATAITTLEQRLRKDIAKNATAITTLEQRLRKDIAKNATAIARVEGCMAVTETVLKSILQAILPGSGNSAASSTTDAGAPKAETESDTDTRPVNKVTGVWPGAPKAETESDTDSTGSRINSPTDAAVP